jgi:hypothetical protein
LNREREAGVLLKAKDDANASLQALLTRMNGKLDELVVNLQKSESQIKKKSSALELKDAEILSLNS